MAALAAVWAATARRPRHRSRLVGRPRERVASAAHARPLWPPLYARGRVGAGRPARPRGAVGGCGIGPGVPQGRGGTEGSVGDGSRVRPMSPTRACRVVRALARKFVGVPRARVTGRWSESDPTRPGPCSVHYTRGRECKKPRVPSFLKITISPLIVCIVVSLNMKAMCILVCASNSNFYMQCSATRGQRLLDPWF